MISRPGFLQERARLEPRELLADRHDVAGLGALLPLGRLELDPCTFGEGLEAFGIDRAEMNEDVLAALVRGDEAIPLRVVELLHDSGCHMKNTSLRGSSERTGGADARPVLALVLMHHER